MHKYEFVDIEIARQLIAGGENLRVEFKRGTRKALNDESLVEAVVCMANGHGGHLLLGVEDNGSVTGFEPRHGDRTDPHRLQAMILNRTEPPIACDVDLVRMGANEIAIVTVPKAASPVGTKSGRYVRRTLQADGKPQCLPYPLHEMLSFGLSAQERDYAATPARGCTLSDLDSGEFQRFRDLCGSAHGDEVLKLADDLDILRALRLALPDQGNQLTLGAVLLFGTPTTLQRFVPSAEVVFHESRADVLVDSGTMYYPLFRAAQRLYELLEIRNTVQEVIVGIHRIEVPRIPQGTIREAIANALVHRDYSQMSPVNVHLSESQFRVSSPGGFPSGITMSNLLQDSRPRSPILAEAFRRAGLVDRAGRGVSLMYRQLLRAGRGEPDYSMSNDNTVVLTIETSDADLEIVRFLAEYEDATQSPLTLLDLRLLHELKTTGPQTGVELAQALREALGPTRGQLARLVELGLVEARGSGRGRRYHLSAAFYRSAESTEYVHLLDTDPIQQGQMVMSFVDQYGRITRSKAAQLCRLSPQQARVLLRRLVDEGELELRGERRGAHYVRKGSPPSWVDD